MNDIQTDSRQRTRADLLNAVAAIRDTLASRCEAEEAAATLSQVTVDALYDAGILRMKLPAALGGGEADPVTQFEVIEALAMINASAAWCTMVGATSLGMPGAFLPDEGVARMFPAGRIPRGAIVVMPAGVARPVAGGYRLSGRWAFASGVRHAEWIVACSRLIVDDALPPEIFLMVLPASEVVIHDNWQVAGLKGTGSCDITIEDKFVPGYMAWDMLKAPPQRGGPLYRLGLPAFVANEHTAFALGVARRALDTLIAGAVAKKRGYAPGAASLANRASVQRMIGHSEMRLRAARALAVELNEDAWQTVVAGRLLSGQQQSALRSAGTYCTEVAAEITTQAFRYAGGSAIYSGHVMQRCLRDVQVAAQHLIISETSYENLGQFMLGFEDADPMR